MTQSLEDLKKKAREVAVPGHTALGFTFTFTAKDLDTLIEQVYGARTEEVLAQRREAQQEERQYILNTIELYNQKPSKGLEWLKWFLTRKTGENGVTTPSRRLVRITKHYEQNH